MKRGGFPKAKGPRANASAVNFFWDQKGQKSRSRFNLLLLEYGEYLLEDLSAFYFPIPTKDLSVAFEVKDSLKVQGRLKLCSRSLMFEPADVRYPIMKFPYKVMLSDVEVFRLKEEELERMSVDLSGCLTFTCTSHVEMKENDKTGPYKNIDYISEGAGAGGHRLVFGLVHAQVLQFLVKVEQLRHIYSVSKAQGNGAANQLLMPFVETAQLWTLHFDTSHLVDFHEKLMLKRPVAVKKIKPLTVHPGSLMVTEARVYFQHSQLNNTGESILHFDVRHIARLYRRRFQLQQTGLEFILKDNSSHLFVTEDNAALRDQLYNLLLGLKALPAETRRLCEDSRSGTSAHLSLLRSRWQRRELSTFEYLMALNTEADRSVNDITQYPVFPHVIADYKSKKLRLEDPETFRDLSKPVGALNQERLQYFQQRMESMPEADLASGIPPPFLYGTHYSTPGYVLHYLVRCAPDYMLCLQNGKFDAPDRMFLSVEGTWQSCLHNPTDLKELVPEFFTGSGEFLVNLDDLDLGFLQTGERLNDVDLPPWADSPRDFIRKNAKALESDHVSRHIHLWIDLIFGCKQGGAAAVAADNVFYHLTYEGAVDLDCVTDRREKDALVLQIQEFGQTPRQLFGEPHPSRDADPLQCVGGAEQSDQSGAESAQGMGGSSLKVTAASAASAADRVRPQSAQSSQSTLGLARPDSDTCSGQAQTPTAEGMRIETGPSTVYVHPHHYEEEGEDGAPGVASLDLSLDEDFREQVARELSGKQVAGASSSSSVNREGRSPQRGGSGGSLPPMVVVTPPRSLSDSREKPEWRGEREGRGERGQDLMRSVYGWMDSTFGSSLSKAQGRRPVSTPVEPSPVQRENASINSRAPAQVSSTSSICSSSSDSRGDQASSLPMGWATGDPQKLVLQGTESFYWHSKAVTGVSAVLFTDTSHSAQGRDATRSQAHAGGAAGEAWEVTSHSSTLIASVARDAVLKISRVDQRLVGELSLSSNRGDGERGGLQVRVEDTAVTSKRTSSVSGSSLSSCCLLSDRNCVLFSSWDNHIYGYSVSQACTTGKTYAHDDAVTSLSLDSSESLLLSGSLDATVKLWAADAVLTSRGDRGSKEGAEEVPPLAEFNLHSAVLSVAIDSRGTVAAAGAEDGTVKAWDLRTRTLLFSYAASNAGEAVRCVRWLCSTPSTPNPRTSTREPRQERQRLLCGTEDGLFACLDVAGRVVASLSLDVAVRSLDTDGKLIFGGCSDGSIRCWVVQEVGDSTTTAGTPRAQFVQVLRHNAAHSGAINSLQLSFCSPLSTGAAQGQEGRKPSKEENVASSTMHSRLFSAEQFTAVLVSASDDCAVRLWRLHFAGDY